MWKPSPASVPARIRAFSIWRCWSGVNGSPAGTCATSSGHLVEIITGAQARLVLDDGSCGLAALTMQTAFAAGDLAGGIVRGVNQLADHARQPDTLHTEHI